MRVAFDISELGASQFSPQSRRGISRVVEEVGRALLQLAREGRSELALMVTSVEGSSAAAAYLAAQADEPWNSAELLSTTVHRRWTAIDHRLRTFSSDIADRALVKRILRRLATQSLPGWRQAAVHLKAFQPETVDVFHSPAVIPLPRYVLSSRRPACFLTLYDLIPFRYPDLVAPESIAKLKSALIGFNHQHFAICISQHVKDDVCEYLRLDPSHVFVASLAADAARFYHCTDAGQIADVRQRCHLPDRDSPYLLSLCALEPRKNLLHLIRCFARLRREDPVARDLRLVLVGQAVAPHSDRFRALIAEERLEDHVVLTGYVADPDLAPLYSGALAFVFPSLAEGFGLPPLEAMQCGVPVICSDRTSLPEVIGDAGLLIDPEDPDILCEAMRRVSHDSALRTDLSRRSLARAAQFSWDRCAADHLKAYRKAVELKSA